MNMHDTKSGLPRVSRDFNEGYTKAIQDIMRGLEGFNGDLKLHKKRIDYKWIGRYMRCFLENRAKFREDFSAGTDSMAGFIRIKCVEKGKEEVEYYKPVLKSVENIADLILSLMGEEGQK